MKTRNDKLLQQLICFMSFGFILFVDSNCIWTEVLNVRKKI